MSQYNVVVSKSAAKELLKLPATVNNRIIKVILELSDDPRTTRIKKTQRRF
jgi:mRNA interferase RelE/StbE